MDILSYLKSKKNSSNVTTGMTESGYQKRKQELEDFIGEQYSSAIPQKQDLGEVPSYERFEYEAPSDESISSTAQQELRDYLSSGESSIKDEYAAKAKALDSDKANSERLLADSSEKLKAAYEQSAEALSNDSLKRGLARSSIALNNQAEASKAYNDNINALIAERNERVADLDAQLNELDGQLQSALDSFKIGYAAKLTERINELKSEREKNKREAIEYNNSLLSKEYEQNLNKQKAESELYSEALSNKQKLNELRNNLTDEEKTAIERNIYDKLSDALASMPADRARMLLNENFIRDALSDRYYYALYYKYNR